MNKAQIIKDILKAMEDKGVELVNLSFEGDYRITVNKLDIVLAYKGDRAIIYYNEGKKHVKLLENLAHEVVTLLPEKKWKSGQLVRKLCATRVLVSSPENPETFNLLDDDTYELEYTYTYTSSELADMGWEREK